MVNIANLLISSWPQGGMWETLIGWFYVLFKNYALTIIIFTIVLKLVLFPLDLFQKRTAHKNATMNAKLQPQMAELQKRYGNNKDLYNQKLMELYKKENFSLGGSCLGMLVTFVLTIVIFMTLWNALGKISATKIVWQYQELNSAYVQTIENNSTLSDEDKIQLAQQAVNDKYNEIKDSFLWIENIWQPDTYASPVLSFKEFDKIASQYKVKYLAEGETKEEFKAQYELVTVSLRQKYDRWNGYFILVVLAGVITFVSQKVLTKMNAPKQEQNKNSNNEPDPTQSTNKVMSIIMPLIMVWFTWSSSSAFALYIIVNSIVGMLTSIACNAIFKAIEKRKQNKEAETLSYKR